MNEVWYKQFWPWFIIFLPASAVVAGLYTLYLSFIYAPDIVVDNYHKKGKEIHLGSVKTDIANKLKMQFNLKATETEIVITQSMATLNNKVHDLKLQFIHPTLAKLDLVIKSTINEQGEFIIPLNKLNKNFLNRRFNILLSDIDTNWQLNYETKIISNELLYLIVTPLLPNIPIFRLMPNE